MRSPTGNPSIPKDGFTLISQTPNMIMTEVTNQTLFPFTRARFILNSAQKNLWPYIALSILSLGGSVLAPKFIVNLMINLTELVINAIRWRSSLFFLFGSFDLVTNLHEMVHHRKKGY